ncbi:MAG: MOSC domain-containing protein [Planctomycetota bacterium]|nr:MAG: MOSC domain-containing protein [Planctomycetota bacterium]REJ92749.1 MAG: MOSC domain-containing protein [Planctomycetota bacterium]REK23787.1 MAG: MOSC domain-containing protein [Planctomycetota bacterium]REK47640.1 MAG: MOSC domain-containing protein [Planctomycetota bacterium]
MELVSVNCGKPRRVNYQGRLVDTGIFKNPVEGSVMMHELGLDGDGQADLRVHGGLDKAVYAYPYEHYAFWKGELERDDFTFGQFGENLTTQGLTEDDVAIGDVLQIGEAEVEVTQPRSPCFKLAIRMERPDIVKRFIKAGRSGFYLRVLREGPVAKGDAITRVRRVDDVPTIRQLLDAYYNGVDRLATYERAIAVEALSQSWRNDLVERLVEARGQHG